MTKPKLYVMCGLPGSGKTTWIKNNLKGIKVCSTNDIRESLGNVNDQSINSQVFDIAHEMLIDTLSHGESIVFDATNIQRKRRMELLKRFNKINCEKICIFMQTPIEACKENNMKRDRTVPEKVIDRMYQNFNIPTILEGFNMVCPMMPKVYHNSYGTFEDWYEKYKDFDQENSHHSSSLGDHCKLAGEYISEAYHNLTVFDKTVYCAALFHDNAKYRVKSYRNGKGEITSDAHYFNHDKVSAYDSLFYKMPYEVDALRVALIIEYHMKPYLAWNQSRKVLHKDENILGKGFISDVMKLHEADINAH